MPLFNPVTASQVVGLGTAAVKNTGVSGDAVPVLNGAATTWAAAASFGGSITLSANATYVRAINGAAADVRVLGFNGATCFVGPVDSSSPVTLNAGGGAITTGGNLDVTGLLRCDTFQVDQTPVAATPTPTHTVIFVFNGVNYRVPCVI